MDATDAMMRKHVHRLSLASDSTSRRNACATIKSLAFDDSNFEALLGTEVIEALVRSLTIGVDTEDIALVRLASDALWSLSADKGHRDVMIMNAGVVPLLSRMLLLRWYPSIAETAAATISNMIDLQKGFPKEVMRSLQGAGGVEGLVELLPVGAPPPHKEEAEGASSVAVTLAALAIDPAISDAIRKKGGVPRLVEMLRAGARSADARHAAAALARMAHNNGANQAAIREAGGISAILDLCEESLTTLASGPLVSEGVQQAAQHGAAALWVLAADPGCLAEITSPDRNGLQALASMVSGRLGPKAEGNAAGALSAILSGLRSSRAMSECDPSSVLADFGYESLLRAATPSWSPTPERA